MTTTQFKVLQSREEESNIVKNPYSETQDKTAMIEGCILRIRGSAAILDSDLALIYGVVTKVLNQAVKRNLDRFPPDFMFRLTTEEKIEVVTICDHLARIKFSPVLPYAFTEHGAIMAASILNSPRAIRMSVFIVRAFVRMREQLLGRTELERHLAHIDRTLIAHDSALRELYRTIKPLLSPPQPPPKDPIGFQRPFD